MKLLDICKGASFRIVNGRIGNSDQFTFLSNNGCSVIDYHLTKESNFSQIQKFYIQRFNEWSDHAPLCFSLLCNNRLHSEEKQSDTKYKWNDSLREQFRSGIIRILPTFNDIVHNINCPDRDSINVLIDKFSNTIRDVADPLFAKDCFYSHDTYFEGYTKRNKDWFDHDCIVARNMYLEALKLFYVDKSDTNRCKN